MRGQGHSFFGQTQVAGGVFVDSSSLNAVRIIKSGAGATAEMGPGSKWHPVLMAANAHKLTVPVITDTFLSVGGTISTGGFGVTTYKNRLEKGRELSAGCRATLEDVEGWRCRWRTLALRSWSLRARSSHG